MRRETETQRMKRQWREAFQMHILRLTQLCSLNVDELNIEWEYPTSSEYYKSAKTVEVTYKSSSDFKPKKVINVECDSPLAIVQDVWKEIR